jgi:hypothetical protein
MTVEATPQNRSLPRAVLQFVKDWQEFRIGEDCGGENTEKIG